MENQLVQGLRQLFFQKELNQAEGRVKELDTNTKAKEVKWRAYTKESKINLRYL